MTRSSGVELFIKREDLLHRFISGNKFRKLKYNLEHAKKLNATQLITFGGAYSNHILAVAAAGYEHYFQTIGIIRGEEIHPLNPTLDKAQNMFGMQLRYVDRSSYRNQSDKALIKMLGIAGATSYIIPEGGTNNLAIKGCTEIVADLKRLPDYLCCSCGTGGTIAGIISGINGVAATKILGFSSLKGEFLKRDVEKLLLAFNGQKYQNWDINTHFHFGGYARFKPALIDFINHFWDLHQVPLDPIYTGKMMYGIYELLKDGFFKKGQNIMAIHTGGLQGIEGFNQRHGNLIHI
ncbi:pyridoxal-phosphate dependent enzyme [Fulvivirgaceae bacterium BMA12]|uniref:Pyridoxal-phosphate dependent enzyme n=1 Tax=Agaribacillus aureus TaxID=3051825 RepID=A0ABT8LF25_9BACT|nr:pyridoxal-phosphate dependent enzyme [Fulvivirgaceae bacterium BMA12]